MAKYLLVVHLAGPVVLHISGCSWHETASESIVCMTAKYHKYRAMDINFLQ